ncbi:MAG: YeiH family protein [Pseudomonadota bacterium]|nr:YeiH family protein [Pseudomonadota bacterium]
MSGITPPETRPAARSQTRSFWQTEDWWAVWIGLGLTLVAYILFAQGSSLRWLAVAPSKWSNIGQLGAQLAGDSLRYLAQFLVWLALLTSATTVLGFKPRDFVPAFALLYVLSIAIIALGAWDKAQYYNLEPPLVALLLGLFISNAIGLPRWLDAGFRVEFYVKTGIVLLGATLPFTLILWAGPIAILQASIVSIATFLTIFFVGKRLGLDRRLAATLGAGGAVCGVSAAIAIAGAVRAKKEHPPIAITLVIGWAIVMIFVLPFVAAALHMPAGVGGAWIGTSEFADAAGFAAAQAYGGQVGPVTGITGTPDQAVWSYTLIKVVGRDVWIGIWALVLSLISVTRWETRTTNQSINYGQIWWRFPKFVVGFVAASLLITAVVSHASFSDYNTIIKPGLVTPITSLRIWAFTFCFLSIGLTTRLRDLAPTGSKPFLAFTAGVVVNVVIGFVLSYFVFYDHWATLTQ